MVSAERQVAHQLTRGLLPAQANALDALLTAKEGASISRLAWARQPPGAPGHRALARLVEQRTALSAIGLDPASAESVHPERLRKLAREGARFTAQHLRALSPPRRRATLVATVLDTIARLTDDTVALFERAIGRMFRRAEIREKDALIRDARAINDKVRLLAMLGAALIEAKESGADLQEAVASAIGWDKLARSVEEAKRLARPDKADLPALGTRAWPVLHRLGPLFLGSLRLQALPAAAATLRAVELLRSIYESGGRKWPRSLPTSFLRPAWREAVLNAGGAERRIWEAATLLALRDRLRAGDIWVEGSRQWRAVEDQLIGPALFAAMREAGPLPVAAPATAGEYLAERRALLDRRLCEVAANAAADKLEDVRINGDGLKITPLKAVTPEAAETIADRLYAMVPNLRITSLLAEVDRWTGFSGAFTHLHSGAPANDRRIVLTAVLADATNLGLTRMSEACSVASYRQLAWTAAWHLREETYRHALATLVNAQQTPAARRAVRRRRCVELGRTALPDRRSGGSRRGGQRPLWTDRLRVVLHAPLGAPGAVPHGRDPAFRRSRLCHRRPALPRSRPEHRDPPHRRRGHQPSRLCPSVPARLLFCAAHSQPRGSASLHFRASEYLAGIRTIHRREDRRKTDRGALG